MLQGDSGCLPIYEVITDQPIRLLRKTPSILAGVFSVILPMACIVSDGTGFHALCDTTLYVVSAEEILIPWYFLRARRECLWGFEITSLRTTQTHANIQCLHVFVSSVQWSVHIHGSGLESGSGADISYKVNDWWLKFWILKMIQSLVFFHLSIFLLGNPDEWVTLEWQFGWW